MIYGIDTATKLTAKNARAVKDAGLAFVGRYLVPPKLYTRKSLTAEEAKIITDAGLRLLTVWETTANRAKSGYDAGVVDGAEARQCAQAINMPTTGIIYFAVDFEATDADMLSVTEYLRGARQSTKEYEIGVYGSYKVVESIRLTGICKAYWQCVGWSYGKESLIRNVYQSQWNKKVAGLSVDINECSDMDRAGIWTYYTEDENDGKEDSPVMQKRYDTVDSLPSWAKPTIRELINAGCIRGNGTAYDDQGYPADLDMSHDMVRILVILDRAGVFDR